MHAVRRSGRRSLLSSAIRGSPRPRTSARPPGNRRRSHRPIIDLERCTPADRSAVNVVIDLHRKHRACTAPGRVARDDPGRATSHSSRDTTFGSSIALSLCGSRPDPDLIQTARAQFLGCCRFFATRSLPLTRTREKAHTRQSIERRSGAGGGNHEICGEAQEQPQQERPAEQFAVTQSVGDAQ